MKTDTYSLLGWLAMAAVPLAPAFFFAWDIYTGVLTLTAGAIWLAAPVAVVSAGGLEAVGMLAGHTTIEFWKRKSNDRAAVAGFIMLAYTIIGLVQLWNTAGAIMFLVAPLVYVLVALRSTLSDEKAAELVQARVQRQVDVENRAHERHMAEERQRLEHEERLAQIKARADVQVAKAAIPAPQPIAESQPAPQLTAVTMPYECSCGRVFVKPQSYSAHTRRCETHRQLSTNGASHETA